MSIPERPVIDDMPPAPIRGQAFSLFNERANAHAAAQQTLVEQVNAGLEWAGLAFDATEQAAQQAQQSASAASSSATASDNARQASVAAQQASETARNEAQTARNEAQFYAEAAAETFDAPALTGNAGKVLTVTPDEEGFRWEEALPPVESGDVGGLLRAKSGGGGEWAPPLAKYEEFTESGTWHKDPNATWVYVEVVSGGPGGPPGRQRSDIQTTGQLAPSSVESSYAGAVVNRGVIRASDCPETCAVVVGAGGSPGIGEKVRHTRGVALGNYFYEVLEEHVPSEDGGESYFISPGFLSSTGKMLPSADIESYEPLRNYPSRSQVNTERPMSNRLGLSSAVDGADGLVDDVTKPKAEGGAAATLNGEPAQLVLKAGDGGNGVSFCSGAQGGNVAAGGGYNPGDIAENVDWSIEAGKGGDGGTGSPGGTGGSASLNFDARGVDAGYTVTLTIKAGDGGKGGDGLVRIWQW